MQRAEGDMAAFVQAAPQAWLWLRLFPGPCPFWADWQEIPDTEISRFAVAFLVNENQIAAIHSRLDAEKTIALMCYAPASFGQKGFEANRMNE